jgi:hypothetical protein
VKISVVDRSLVVAAGALTTDINAWTTWLQKLNMTHYGIWNAVDGTQTENNYYGDLHVNGTALTQKGTLHRLRARTLRGLSGP